MNILQLKRLIREEINLLKEVRYKAFAKVMRQVYDNLPNHVFNDMYSQEKQSANIVDPDIGTDIQQLTAAVLNNQPNAVENFREYERKRGSEWIDTVWSKRAQNVELRWNDLSNRKRDFFIRKYTGQLEYFPARTEKKHGYMDKVERLLPKFIEQSEQSSEPVILLQRHSEPGFDIIGGNNRTFNAFLATAIRELKNIDATNMSLDTFTSIFDYLNKQNPTIRINAFIGRKLQKEV